MIEVIGLPVHAALAGDLHDAGSRRFSLDLDDAGHRFTVDARHDLDRMILERSKNRAHRHLHLAGRFDLLEHDHAAGLEDLVELSTDVLVFQRLPIDAADACAEWQIVL